MAPDSIDAIDGPIQFLPITENALICQRIEVKEAVVPHATSHFSRRTFYLGKPGAGPLGQPLNGLNVEH